MLTSATLKSKASDRSLKPSPTNARLCGCEGSSSLSTKYLELSVTGSTACGRSPAGTGHAANSVPLHLQVGLFWGLVHRSIWCTVSLSAQPAIFQRNITILPSCCEPQPPSEYFVCDIPGPRLVALLRESWWYFIDIHLPAASVTASVCQAHSYISRRAAAADMHSGRFLIEYVGREASICCLQQRAVACLLTSCLQIKSVSVTSSAMPPLSVEGASKTKRASSIATLAIYQFS